MKVKNIFKALSVAALAVAAASCSVSEEIEKYDEITVHQKYYAQIEDPSDPGARTYADGDLKVLWNADDRVSIFSKNTYNQQYRFDGQTGDNSGSFSVVQDPGYVTGNELPYSYSVYPYSESTTISNAGVITMTLPATQTYAVESFGPGDNAMVAVAEGNVIVYKNLGGYLMFKLYGEGITVSSISLKGNNGELLSGTAAVEMPLGGVPSLEFAPGTAGSELTLNCATPVALGSSAESYTAFWFVLPPVTFSKGITITVTEGDGTVFTKTTGGSFSITRNKRSRMAPLQVEPGTALTPPDNEIWYTSTDGNIVTPYSAEAFDANIVSNTYENGKGVIKFDGSLTSLNQQAFYSKTTLASILLPHSVRNISVLALSNTALTQIVLHDGVQMIDNGAFSHNSSLKKVTLPQNVFNLGDNPFSDCGSLESFEGCFASEDGRCLINNGRLLSFAPAGLTGYTVPEGITEIKAEVFYNYTNLTSINLPSSLQIIGGSVFRNCTFTEIELPEGLKSIGGLAFWNCKNLTEITIPESVTTIYDWAFRYCTSLNSITCLPSTPPSGAELMFDDTNDCPIYVPAGSVDAYKAAEYWSNYAERIQAIPEPGQPDNEIWYTTTDGSTVQIANESVLNVGVVSNTYENGKGIIKLDGDLTRIGTIKNGYSSNSDAFLDGTTSSSGARKLKSISFPQSLDVICTWTLLSCKKLESIILPDHLSYLGGGAVDGCTSLTTVAVPDCDEIRYNPFDWCTGIESFSGPQASADGQFIIKNGTIHSYATAGRTQCSIPEGVSSIASNAFNGATIEELSLPSSLESISNSFVGMSQLKRINFSEGLKTIGMHAFEYCSSLTGVTLPESLELLDFAAFASCTSLSQIQIPSGTVIPMNPFAGCSSLASFSGKYASSDGRYLADGTKLLSIAPAGLTSFAVPEGIEVLDWDLFAGCNFVSITIPEGVTTVNCGCFSNCTSLTSLTMPSTWVQYDGALLYNCKSLEKLVSYAATPPTNRMNSTNTFLFNTNNCPIYVPAGAVDAYKAAAVWSDFADRIKPLGEMYETVDLGLPSGAKWASFNIGATSPEMSGLRFAWGETATKSTFFWNSYSFGGFSSETKYNAEDGLTTLEAQDDAARVLLGGDWRMPTHEEQNELWENCTLTVTTLNGFDGYLATSKNNGNSIFLPYCTALGRYSFYWSSTLYEEHDEDHKYNYAYMFGIEPDSAHAGWTGERCSGYMIRPVKK